MKRLIGTLSATAAALLPAATAFAASGAREDEMGFFAWVFMAFCGVIIVGQFIPAIMMMLGLVRGVGSKREAGSTAT